MVADVTVDVSRWDFAEFLSTWLLINMCSMRDMCSSELFTILVGLVSVGRKLCSNSMLKKFSTSKLVLFFNPSMFRSPVILHCLFSLFVNIRFCPNLCLKFFRFLLVRLGVCICIPLLLCLMDWFRILFPVMCFPHVFYCFREWFLGLHVLRYHKFLIVILDNRIGKLFVNIHMVRCLNTLVLLSKLKGYLIQLHCSYPEHRVSLQPSYPAHHSWHGHPLDPSGLCHGWLLPD